MENQHLPTSSEPSAGHVLRHGGESMLFVSGQSAGDSMLSGSHVPTEAEFNLINQGLAGWEGVPDVVGPRYYPSPEIELSLFQILENSQSISHAFIETMAMAKAEVFNTNALLLQRALHPADHFTADAKIFLLDLKVEVAAMDHFLREHFAFSTDELRLLHLFIAKTAPILYNMGFPEAISHSAQVARLCVVQAQRYGADKVELMQAMMVGWLHDPKLESELSWSNLAAHPVTASAIAHQVLNAADVVALLEAWLQTLNNAPDVRTFSQGVENALSINNDSRFILENVILHKPQEALQNNVEPGVGITNHLPQPDREALIRLARQRFESTARGELPEPLPASLQALLLKIPFETGLKGIRLEAICHIFDLSSPEAAESLFCRIIRGEYPNPEQVERLAAHLKKTPSQVHALTISALRLFSHHDEITVGRIPALALAISDPLLLSPHKLLESARQPTALERLQSFIRSFSENIDHLPLPAQEIGELWHRDLLLSILQTAESLTQRPLAKEFQDTEPLKKQIGWLSEELARPQTWVSQDGSVDYGALKPEDARFEILLRIMKEKYEAAAHQSSALYGV